MPESASPDFNCFAWGENINGVPIWFNVNYGGVTGYYASYYDDSSYHSNEELTAKYGIRLCGEVPPPPSSVPSAPPSSSSPPAGTTPAAPAPAAIYFSPYNPSEQGGKFKINDGTTLELGISSWETSCDSNPGRPRRGYDAAADIAGGRPITTLASWSKGHVGVLSYLANASEAELKRINYVLLIDPGEYSEFSCERKRNAGQVFVHWLSENPSAHLIVMSSSEITQLGNSRGIQETYFNAIRRAGTFNDRVLTCNYSLTGPKGDSGHEKIYFGSRYWVQHQIPSYRSGCPGLNVHSATVKPTAGWHPVN
jgi:hypothetical protein